MNGLPLQRDITTWLVGKLPSQFDYLLRGLGRRQLTILMGALVWLFIPLITTRLAIWQQAVLAAILIAFGALLVHLEERQSDRHTTEYLHLLLIMASLITTARYFYYRTNYTLGFDTWLDGIFCLLLYSAELYAILTLILSYFQTLKIKERQPIDLSNFPQEQWWNVDVYIPTYNEDVEIVRKTVLGALAIDYPVAKKQVYILDDGRAEKYRERRETLRQMCEELGCTLITRDNNDHAKAGNINNALKQTTGDLVLILDCDHIPSHGFLQQTVGFFFNPQVALVQTPHWFYNPDPFERNLLTGGRIPVGNELFYKVLQKGNDHWNAAFFCGSAAIIRRDYLLQIGGIATETVTEDCHTSLRLHSLGYETVYYDKIMVAGLAPEKFSSYVGQQVRWARGMAQILRIENPLFNRKLNLRLSQRLCYFSATSHFFFGFPRLMYLLAPVLFLTLGINSVKGLGMETLFYALPHIVLSMQSNHIPYKHVRFSFWNEIYEFALSFQSGMVTLMALIKPSLGKFNVTDKGLKLTERSFDLESIRYLLILGVLTAASLLAVPFWLFLSPQDTQALLINTLWCVVNLFLVIAACLVAFEQPQLRQAHRLSRQITAVLHSGNQSWTGVTRNISETGAQILLDVWPNIPDEVRIELIGDFGARALMDARILRGVATSNLQTLLALEFINPSRTQMDDLIVVLYSDVKEWYYQHRTEKDNPLQSFQFIVTSLKRVFQEFRPEIGVKVRKQVRFFVQLYWEGWGDSSFYATVTEIGSRDLRLELENSPDLNLDEMEATKPIIGLLLNEKMGASVSQSLLAQVQTIHVVNSMAVSSNNISADRVIIELNFPESLSQKQKGKIKQLLRSINERR